MERAVLGALLLNAAVAWPAVDGVLAAEHFARADHRAAYEAIAELMASGIKVADVAVIADHLERGGRLDAAGGAEYLAQLVDETPSAINARSYALAVREAADSRRWIDITERAGAAARAGDPDEAARIAAEGLDELEISASVRRKAKSLAVDPVSAWADRPDPPPRDWIMQGLIPAARVTSLFGNGGLGKTLLAVQIALHTAMSKPLFGVDISGGPVLGVFCEDEQDELERRGRAACKGQMAALEDIDRCYLLSRDGEDSYLCSFEHERIQFTRFYYELDATIADIKPRLVILDTAADLFAGDFVSTPHVRQFLKIALGGLCARHECAVLLLAHPSASAISSGDGGGFSMAWNNSVRSRLYLRRPLISEGNEASDRRILEVKKANYAASDGLSIPLAFEQGYFVLDPDPIDEVSSGKGESSRGQTRLAVLAHEYLKNNSPGMAIPFAEITDHLLGLGAISRADRDATRRKQVQRALNQLVQSGLVQRCQIPRGSYRLPTSGTWDNHETS